MEDKTKNNDEDNHQKITTEMSDDNQFIKNDLINDMPKDVINDNNDKIKNDNNDSPIVKNDDEINLGQTVKFDLTGVCNDKNVKSDDKMINLEESSSNEYLSNNNDEYFSAKDYNFGLIDEINDELSKLNEVGKNNEDEPMVDEIRDNMRNNDTFNDNKSNNDKSIDDKSNNDEPIADKCNNEKSINDKSNDVTIDDKSNNDKSCTDKFSDGKLNHSDGSNDIKFDDNKPPNDDKNDEIVMRIIKESMSNDNAVWDDKITDEILGLNVDKFKKDDENIDDKIKKSLKDNDCDEKINNSSDEINSKYFDDKTNDDSINNCLNDIDNKINNHSNLLSNKNFDEGMINRSENFDDDLNSQLNSTTSTIEMNDSIEEQAKLINLKNDDKFNNLNLADNGVQNNQKFMNNSLNNVQNDRFKILDNIDDKISNEAIKMPNVASITTSVIDVPCTVRNYHTITDKNYFVKNNTDSLENDSLNSCSYTSTGSVESLDKMNAMNDRRIPTIIVSEDGLLTGKTPVSDIGNKLPQLRSEIQTCGKCDDKISRQTVRSYNSDRESNNKQNDKLKKDEMSSDDSSHRNSFKTKSPRDSQQLDDRPSITDVSPEKRSSIFAKMSSLPLDNSASPGGKDSKSSLIDDCQSKFDWRRLLAQVLAVSAKNTLAFNFGVSIGFQTIAIPSLSKENDDLYLDNDQISLFGSLFFTVIPIGCLLSGPTIHGWGRKPAMLLFCLPLFIGWWVYYVANSVAILYTAILLMGLVNGLLEAPILTYVAEITEAKWRGMLASSSIVAALLGVFIQLVLGNILSWRTAAAVNSVFPVLSFICICFVPESPHWLASKGRDKDVEKSLMWLRGWTDRETIAAEAEELITVHRAPKVAATPLSWKAYASRTFIEPFILVLASFAIGHLSGMATVQTYSVSIFSRLGVSAWSWTAAMGATQVLGALVCVIALPLIGKRPIAVISMFAVAIGMAGAATTHGALAASALLLANFGTNACSRVVPWVLIGEVFTNEMRAVASGLSSCLGYAMGFLLSFTYLRVEEALTLRGILGVYSAAGLIGAIAYYVYLPETEGKSLAEVQEHFARKKKKNGVDNPAFEKDKP